MWGAVLEANIPWGGAKNYLDSVAIPFVGRLGHWATNLTVTSFINSHPQDANKSSLKEETHKFG